MVGQQILALPVGVRVPAPQLDTERGTAVGGVPYFFDRIFMAAPSPRTSKTRYLPLIVGLIGVSIVVILGSVICVQFTFWLPRQQKPLPTDNATSSALDLPTAPPPTATPGPPIPEEIVFMAEEPIRGFSDCNKFGFWGRVSTSNESRLQGVQIVLWESQAGLLALSNTDTDGGYLIEIEGEPAQRKLWVQVFEGDLPVSEPVFVETQSDCQNGFQVFQLDWRQAD